MSLNTAANLLRQYNQKSPYTRDTIDTKADQTENKLGTWSYANMYDALYNKFSQYKNFNMHMWQDALKLGEQDQYLAFLEENKDTQLSNQFYDSQYYDYETMMLEMYLPFANKANIDEPRTTEIHDPVTGDWIQEEIGKMSDYDWVKYQIESARKAKQEEITLAIEDERKREMSWIETVGHDVLAFWGETAEGVLSGITTFIDVFTGLGYATTGAIVDGKNWFDLYTKYFAEESMTAAEQEFIRASLDEYERTHTHFRDIDGNITGVGTYVAGVANSIGMMVPSIIINLGTAGAGGILSHAGSAMFYTGIFGRNVYENATDPNLKDTPAWNMILNAGVKTAVEAVVEYALGQVLGGTVQNKLIGIPGKVGKNFVDFGKFTGLGYVIKSALQEGFEEFLQDFSTSCVDQFMSMWHEGYANRGVTIQTLLDSFFAGVLSSLVMTGGHIGMSEAKAGLINRHAKNKGEYNLQLNAGPGDMLIERDGKLQKLRGWNRLYFSSIISDFNESVEKLKKGKFSAQKNIELAQEVYGALNTMMQYFSSFDAERLNNCKTLLDRVINAQTDNAYLARHPELFNLNPNLRAGLLTGGKTERRQATKSRAQELGIEIENTFKNMYGGTLSRAELRRVTDILEKNADKLAKNNVTDLEASVGEDGIVHTKNGETININDAEQLVELEKLLGKEGLTRYKELQHRYQWLFLTNGHVAIEDIGEKQKRILFVPVKWLENYELSDIYYFLSQSKVLDDIISDSDLNKPVGKDNTSMIDRLVEFVKKYAGTSDVSKERALMEFLFNKTVYQAFLLSQDGKNLHDFGHFVAGIYNLVKAYTEASGWVEQKDKDGKPFKDRVGVYKKMLNKMRKTMREANLKAILNWNVDPETIAADVVLTDVDREYIVLYKKHREMIAKAVYNGVTSAYQHSIAAIKANGGYTEQELTLIDDGLKDDATPRQKLLSRLLLDHGDFYTGEESPFDSGYFSSDLRYMEESEQKTAELISRNTSEATVKASMMDTLTSIFRNFREEVQESYASERIKTTALKLLDKFEKEFAHDLTLSRFHEELTGYMKFYESLFGYYITTKEKLWYFLHDKLHITENDSVIQDVIYSSVDDTFSELEVDTQVEKVLSAIENSFTHTIDELDKYWVTTKEILRLLSSDLSKNEKPWDSEAFTIPYQALRVDTLDNHADAQFVADQINAFTKRYGISPRQMIRGELNGMSAYQRDVMLEDATAFGIDVGNTILFVTMKLESMLGKDYVVTPTNRYLRADSKKSGDLWMYLPRLSKRLGELDDEHESVKDLIFRAKRALYRSDKNNGIEWTKKFYNTAVSIFPNEQSKYSKWYGKISEKWSKDFAKHISELDTDREVLQFIIDSESAIDRQYQHLKDSIREDMRGGRKSNNPVDDFVVAKKISATEFIPQELLDYGDIFEQDEIFEKLFEKDTHPLVMQRMQEQREWALGNEDLLQAIAAETGLDARSYIEDLFSRIRYGEFMKNWHENGVIIDPSIGDLVLTRENGTTAVFDNLSRAFLLYDLLLSFIHDVPVRSNTYVSDIIDVSKFSPELSGYLSSVLVEFEEGRSVDYAGYFSSSENKIVLCRGYSDHLSTFVHEVNHAIQHAFYLPSGFNKDAARSMPDLLKYVFCEYPEYVAYVLRKHNKSAPARFDEETFNTLFNTNSNILNDVAFCAYMLVQGEIWARTHIHNDNVHGFKEMVFNGRTYLLAPDGVTKFPTGRVVSNATSTEAPALTEPMAESALSVTLTNILEAREDADIFGYSNNEFIRNTYHTRLTKVSPSTIVMSLVRKSNLVEAVKKNIRLDDLIHDPETFLREDILEIFGKDYSEGNVFYGLKEYIEQTAPGISIDRNSVTNEYILVSDNSFDDLLHTNLLAETDNFDDTTLSKKYSGKGMVPLSTFYREDVLRNLDIDPNTPIIIAPNAKSETILTREYPTGLISIRADEFTSNAKLIDVLNHEFRHLMQIHNYLETGFTPDFTVTKEMIADVKKNAPEIFKNEKLVEFAKRYAKMRNTSLDEEIVRNFVYILTGGELNAYGFAASLLSVKPIYVTKEGGRLQIFMPWYDAKTGAGRYDTDYLAMRADDTPPAEDTKTKKKKKSKDVDDADVDLNERKRIDAARRKLPKDGGISFRNMPQEKGKFKHTRSYVSRKRAGDTNLKYFLRKGKRLFIDDALADFIVATTGHEDEISHELMSSILDGTLTRQSFEKWLRKVSPKKINDFTFKLINKHIYKNDHIVSMEQLNKILTVDPQIYWALNVILLKHGAPLQSLVQENNLNTFMEFIKKIENSDWWTAVQEMSILFDNYEYLDANDKLAHEHIGIDPELSNYMRVYAMEYFNGTLAGAFKMAHAFRKTLFSWEDEKRKTISLDEELGDEDSDDRKETRADKIGEGDINDDAVKHFGNDILAIYAQVGGNAEDADMINYIASSKYVYEVKRHINSLNVPDKTKKRFYEFLGNPEKLREEIAELERRKTSLTDNELGRLKNDKALLDQSTKMNKDISSFREGLYELSTEELAARYSRLRDIEISGSKVDIAEFFDLDRKFARKLSLKAEEERAKRGLSKDYDAVKGRVERRANKIIGYITTKQINFEDLPEKIRDMFEYVTVTESGTRRKIKELRHKKIVGVTEVGRGRAKLPGSTDSSRKDYVPKHDITKGTDEFRHSVEPLLETEQLLDATIAEIERILDERENAQKSIEKKLKKTEQDKVKLEKKLKKAEEQLAEAKKKYKSMTHFTIEKKNTVKVSDTPNNFEIISAIPMPDVLKTLLDVSFTKMADTKVQFVSKDKDGRLYDAATMKEKDFKSVMQHEVANWQLFYEAVRGQLLALTRTDALDIIEFIERGAFTLGPANKLAAFEIYLLGYCVDLARGNKSNWNFSPEQIEHLEALYERRASIAGSMLHAVKDMLPVVNPFKTVQSRMLDDFISVSEDDRNDLTAAVEKLQNEKDRSDRIKLADDLNKKLNTILRNEFTARNKSTLKLWRKEFWDEENLARLREQVKSFRYMSMLSSPITWLRNKISNTTTLILNSTADLVARIAFTGRGYRDDQWDLTHTKISPEVKAFIDEYIKKNPIFDPLYNMSGKYDERQRKKIGGEKELFVNLISSAMEERYAANYRFDINTLNYVNRFVNYMLSDAGFIKFVSAKYFGKMLTIEAKKGKIDLSKGLSADVLNLFADAVIAGSQEYMHKRSFLADSIDKMRDEHPNVYGLINVFFPFINSSFNWFLETLKYTPLGLIGSIVRLNRLEQQIVDLENRRNENRELVINSRMAQYLTRRDVGKGILGLLLSLLGAGLAFWGLLRVEEEDEKIYVIAGDVKVDMSSIFGTSSVLVGASIAQRWIKQSNGETMSLEEVIEYAIGYTFDDFFIADMFERHRYDQTFYDHALTEMSSILNSFTPRFWSLIVTTFNNDKIKYSNGMKNVWERWINSFHPGQPAGSRRIDPYTGEIVTRNELPAWEPLKSLGIRYNAISENERMCREYGVNKNELDGEITVNGQKKILDKTKLNEYYGKLNNVDLAKIKSQNHTVEMPDGKFQSLSWDNMSDLQRARVLERTMTKNAEIAKIYIWTQIDGHKYYTTESMWSTLKKHGITQNVYKGDKGFVE